MKTIQYTGRRKSRFKIGHYWRIVRPLDILELPEEECEDLIRNSNFVWASTGNKQPLRFFLNSPDKFNKINGMLEGKRCFIVGRGESLRGFDFSRLKNEFVIVINEAMLSCPSNAVVFCDRGMWRENKDALFEYTGYIFAAERTKYYEVDKRDNVYIYPLSNFGLGEKIEYGMYSGASSGMIAINIALCMKAREIYLLGYDMLEKTGHKYFDDLSPVPQHYANRKWLVDQLKCYTEHFSRLDNVYNLNPDSGIKCFQYRNVDEVI